MAKDIRITRIEVEEFECELGRGVSGDGSGFWRTLGGVRVSTNVGITGEYVGRPPVEYAGLTLFAQALIGRNPLEREKIYDETKWATRQNGRLGMGVMDIALWDIAGKYYEAPVYELLGGYRRRLPAYASTYPGEPDGELNSPEAYADFAVRCKEIGYPAFKIHPVKGGNVRLDRATVLAVREAVGDDMELMLDPSCAYNTFADAVQVGYACDDARYYWYEDPYKDGGVSQHAHRKLRQILRTPILQCEHVRSLEPHVDFMASEATDLVRVDPDFDGGITGAMKIAHAAEGFGLDVELHNCGPAHRHVMASVRNSNFYEMALVHPTRPATAVPVYTNGYRDDLNAVDGEGCVPVPEGPGLGVGYDWEYIRKHRTGHQVYR